MKSSPELESLILHALLSIISPVGIYFNCYDGWHAVIDRIWNKLASRDCSQKLKHDVLFWKWGVKSNIETNGTNIRQLTHNVYRLGPHNMYLLQSLVNSVYNISYNSYIQIYI